MQGRARARHVGAPNERAREKGGAPSFVSGWHHRRLRVTQAAEQQQLPRRQRKREEMKAPGGGRLGDAKKLRIALIAGNEQLKRDDFLSDIARLWPWGQLGAQSKLGFHFGPSLLLPPPAAVSVCARSCIYEIPPAPERSFMTRFLRAPARRRTASQVATHYAPTEGECRTERAACAGQESNETDKNLAARPTANASGAQQQNICLSLLAKMTRRTQ